MLGVAAGTDSVAMLALCATEPETPATGDRSAAWSGPAFACARWGRPAVSEVMASPVVRDARSAVFAVASGSLVLRSDKPDALAAPARLALGARSVADATVGLTSRAPNACLDVDASWLSTPMTLPFAIEKSKASALSFGAALLAGGSSSAGHAAAASGGIGAARISAATSTGTANGGFKSASTGTAMGRVSPALSVSLWVSAAPGFASSSSKTTPAFASSELSNRSGLASGGREPLR